MKKIMIACQCSTNKGDRAIAEFLIRNLRKQYPKSEIIISSTEPQYWEFSQESNIKVIGPAYKHLFRKRSGFLGRVFNQLNWFIYKIFVFPRIFREKKNSRLLNKISHDFIECVKESDIVIVTGGHHITSLRNQNALFAITYDLGLISMYSNNYYLWSQTIGPLKFTNKRSKKFIFSILQNSKLIFIRDSNSLTTLKNVFSDNFHAIEERIVKTYDSVFWFAKQINNPISERKKQVGISIFNGLKKAFDNFAVIAQLLDYLSSLGYEIVFFKMEHSEKETGDIHKIIGMMKNNPTISIVPFSVSIDEHLIELSKCRIFIGYKTHSIIMSLATATPLLAICYHEKSRDFMKDFDLDCYALDDTHLSFDECKATINNLFDNVVEIYNLMNKKRKDMVENIDSAMKIIYETNDDCK